MWRFRSLIGPLPLQWDYKTTPVAASGTPSFPRSSCGPIDTSRSTSSGGSKTPSIVAPPNATCRPEPASGCRPSERAHPPRAAAYSRQMQTSGRPGRSPAREGVAGVPVLLDAWPLVCGFVAPVALGRTCEGATSTGSGEPRVGERLRRTLKKRSGRAAHGSPHRHRGLQPPASSSRPRRPVSRSTAVPFGRFSRFARSPRWRRAARRPLAIRESAPDGPGRR